jgi:cytochrome P450
MTAAPPDEQRPGCDLAAPLADPDFYRANPHPHFARLRAEAPLAWNDEVGFWAVTRHAEVLAISKDPITFCSGKGILLRDIERDLPESPEALLYYDPPDHGRYRKMVQPAFAPSRIRALEPLVRARTQSLFDGIELGAPVDVVAALAAPLPLLVIADLFGVPEADVPALHRWTDAIIALATEATDENLALATEMAVYFLERIAERTVDPRHDLISLLATTEVDGERLTEAELMMFCGQLLVGGNETTRNLISGGLVAFAEFPAEYDRLRADPGLVPTAVEELLRWTTPVTSFLRTATVDTVVGDQPVAAGEPLLLLYLSANRDEAVFGANAGQLDIGRQPNNQVAFGFGEHFCIGAALARLEGRVFLEELVARVGRIELAAPVERLASSVINGIVSAPLRLS